MRKKTLSLVLVCIMLASIFVVPASAATTGNFSGITGKMNSLYGLECAKQPISSGTLSSSATATKVEVTVTVSSGSDPFYLTVYTPGGSYESKRIGSSGTYTFSSLVGVLANGKWNVTIQTTGTVSTATATLKVTYNP